MTRLVRSFVVGAGALVLSLGVAGTASAIPFLDFAMDGVHGAGASVSYAGGGAALVGTGLSVDSVAGLGGTPLNDNDSLVITGGLLAFETGANGGGYTWGANPDACDNLADADCSIVITGGIASLGIAPGTVLLAGRITSAQVVGGGIIAATFVNFINANLAAHFGLPGGDFPWVAANTLNLGLSLFNGDGSSAFTCAIGDANPCQPGSGDLPTTPAPEPGTLILLGSGLFAAASGARRKLSQL